MICQNVLMIILAQLVLNTVEKEDIYLLCIFEVICGKEKISVWEMAFGYNAHHQQSINIFDGIVQTSLKRTDRDGGVAHCLDPTSPPRLMSNEQSLQKFSRSALMNNSSHQIWHIELKIK